MANRENGRGRLLCLLEILQKETDAEHGLSTQDLITKLDEAGFPVNRKTLYDDIHALEDSSVPVEKSGGKVPKYYIEDREFEPDEIMLLIDAVESAGFLTEKKKAAVIKKLKGLTSSAYAAQLNEQIHYIGQYFANKAVHNAFLDAKDKKSFRAEHSAELALYDAARKFLKNSFPDMVPTLGKLKAERDTLIQAKKEKKDRYDSAKAVQKDLYTARTNVVRILDEHKAIEKSKEFVR